MTLPVPVPTPFASALLLLAILAAGAVQDPPPARTPEPDAAAQKEAEKLVKDVFKDEYARTSPEARRELAKKLLKQGQETLDEITMRYVLLREARDVAAQAGDGETAMRAVDALDATFAIDAPAMKAEALSAAAKRAKTAADLKSMATLYLKLADDAVASDRYDIAAQAADSAGSCAKRAKEASLVTLADARSKEISAFKTRYAAVKKAEGTLAKDPEDPAANLVAGQYYALVKGDWEKGLPLLAKCSDEGLKGLAERELANPAEPAEQAALGDAWWDRAEKESDPAKGNLRGRAAFWYGRATEGGRLEGLARTKAEKRLNEYRREKSGGWEDVSDPGLWGVEGEPDDAIELAPDPAGSKDVTLQKFPPGEFDGMSARLRFRGGERQCHAYLVIEGGDTAVAIDPTGPTVYECRLQGGRWNQGRSMGIPKRAEYVLKALLIGGEWVVFVDGDSKFKFRAGIDAMKSAGLHAHWSAVTFDQIKLRYKK